MTFPPHPSPPTPLRPRRLSRSLSTAAKGRQIMATGKRAMPEFAADPFTGTDDRRRELWIQTSWPIGFCLKNNVHHCCKPRIPIERQTFAIVEWRPNSFCRETNASYKNTFGHKISVHWMQPALEKNVFVRTSNRQFSIISPLLKKEKAKDLSQSCCMVPPILAKVG